MTKLPPFNFFLYNGEFSFNLPKNVSNICSFDHEHFNKINVQLV